MDLLDKIRAALQDRKTAAVAEATGLHPNTIRSIRNGTHGNLTWETIRALASYLEIDQ